MLIIRSFNFHTIVCIRLLIYSVAVGASVTFILLGERNYFLSSAYTLHQIQPLEVSHCLHLTGFTRYLSVFHGIVLLRYHIRGAGRYHVSKKVKYHWAKCGEYWTLRRYD